jgi:hypothetical protein
MSKTAYLQAFRQMRFFGRLFGSLPDGLPDAISSHERLRAAMSGTSVR